MTKVFLSFFELFQVTSRKLPFALHEAIGPSWFDALKDEFDKPYFLKLNSFMETERKSSVKIFPPHDEVWSWTHHFPIEDTKVVILGQDPYHGPGQAHGLCFSVKRPVKPPPSLLNMYKELVDDIEGFQKPQVCRNRCNKSGHSMNCYGTDGFFYLG